MRWNFGSAGLEGPHAAGFSACSDRRQSAACLRMGLIAPAPANRVLEAIAASMCIP
jgi:hypothetical protein